MLRLLPLAALLCLCACSSNADKADKAGNTQNAAVATAPTALLPLVVRTAKGEHRFDVEIAATPEAQEKGLMFRKDLAPDKGMLFPMDPPRLASFWMKNTIIPLDMIFVRTDGSIAFIGANIAPYSREPVSAGIPVAAVLELSGGRAAALGIKEGDRVNWGACAVPGTRPDEAWDRLSFCPR
jgi:uncharacterized membrane protein (UPF0127 family)